MIKLSNTQTVSISSGAIVASGTYTSEAYDCHRTSGLFSLQWLVTGDGTMKAEVLSSNDNVTYLDVNSDITTAQTKSTGTSGANMIDFEVMPCNSFKIKFTETGGAQAITVVAKLITITSEVR